MWSGAGSYAEDPVAWLQARHAGTDLVDDSGQLDFSDGAASIGA